MTLSCLRKDFGIVAIESFNLLLNIVDVELLLNSKHVHTDHLLYLTNGLRVNDILMQVQQIIIQIILKNFSNRQDSNFENMSATLYLQLKVLISSKGFS